MNGKRAKILRKQAGFNPNTPREYGLTPHRYYLDEDNDNEKVLIGAQVNSEGSARKKYQQLKREWKRK